MKYPIAQFIIAALFTCVGAVHAADSRSDAARTNTSLLPKPGPLSSRDQMKPHFGLLAGTVHPEGSYDPGMGYGFEVGLQPYIPFGLGLELTKSRNVGRQSLEDIDQTAVLLRGTYNFGGANFFIRNSYVGVALGQVFKSGHTDIAGAPLLGFDLPLQEKAYDFITIGANAKYLLINGDDPDVLTINGAIKYWY